MIRAVCRTILIVLLFSFFAGPPRADSAFFIPSTYSTSSNCPANDGNAGAPSGSAQYPSLLNGYAVTITSKLGCNVAGVNYPVGYPLGQTFTDPASGGLPSGASYSSSSHTITISGSSLVTLNGWNLHNGTGGCIAILIASTGGVTLTNNDMCYPTGLSAGYIECESGASGALIIKNNIINGGGAIAGQGIEAVYNNGCTSIDFEYNYVENADSGIIAQLTGGSLTYKYNLLVNSAANPGEHLNLLEFAGSNITYSATIQFNTVLQYINGSPGGEVFQFYDNLSGGTLTSADVGYNTLIATSGTNPNAIARVNSTAYVSGTVFSIAGQTFPYYTVCTGTWNSGGSACTGGGGGSTCTTAGSLPSNYGFASIDTTFTDGTCKVQGSNYAVSNVFHGSNDTTFQTKMSPGPAQIHDNFIDGSATQQGNVTSCTNSAQSMYYGGTFGTANPPSGTVAWTAPSGNYDMASGTAGCTSYP